MEIIINKTAYPLKASLAFLNEIERTKIVDAGGMQMENGLVNAVIQIREMGDVRALADVIMALNVNQTPRMCREDLNAWIEDGDADLEKFGEQVVDFLSKANVCKAKLKKLGLLSK